MTRRAVTALIVGILYGGGVGILMLLAGATAGMLTEITICWCVGCAAVIGTLAGVTVWRM